MTKKEKERQERVDQIARLMVENEREQIEKLELHFREMTALIVLSIAMGQAAHSIVKDACNRHDIVSNPLTNKLRREAKNTLTTAVTSLKTAKGCLTTFDSMQEIFTSSFAINPSEQMIIGEDMLRMYHEIAELCCLYSNAYHSNKDIMEKLRPIFMGQTKADGICICNKTIEGLKLKKA